ncbi:hypothetical protein JVT61DRAFT_11432 [Boletus reticuloceps]|uniref:Uncharacterized protein n=1 Tax=Boletus reticuloceps TaxID=495285 RepID=A0A8I3A4V1_9AGAM|nr:hypothetical protein JVT61DRAFT_11432 [Boletus reticuloceps]
MTQTPTPSTKPKPLAETQGDPVPTSQPTPTPTTPQLPTMMQEDPTPPSQPNSAPTTPQRHIRMQEDPPALSVPAPVTPSAAASPNHRQHTLVNITPVLQAHLSMAQEHRCNTTIQTRTPNPSAFPAHTPRPINGFPETHLRHSAQLFDDMDQSAIATWDASVPEPKLLARIFDFIPDRITPENTQTVIATMKEIINGIEYELQLHETQPDAKIAPPPLISKPTFFLSYQNQ